MMKRLFLLFALVLFGISVFSQTGFQYRRNAHTGKLDLVYIPPAGSTGIDSSDVVGYTGWYINATGDTIFGAAGADVGIYGNLDIYNSSHDVVLSARSGGGNAYLSLDADFPSSAYIDFMHGGSSKYKMGYLSSIGSFYLEKLSGTSFYPFYVTATNNVGINTSTPAHKLDVNGSILAQDNILCWDTNKVDIIAPDDSTATYFTSDINVANDIYADSLFVNYLAGTIGEITVDTLDVDSLLVNGDLRDGAYFLVADGSGNVVSLMDTTGYKGGGGGSSDWTRSGNDIYPTTATDNIWGKDSIVVGENGGTSGVIELTASDGDKYQIMATQHGYLSIEDVIYIYNSGSKAAIGGQSSDLSGANSVTLGYVNETKAAAVYGVAMGYRSRADSRSQVTHASGRFTNTGDAQGSEFMVFADETHADNTWYTLYAENDAVNGRINILASSAWFFRADIVMTNDAQDTTAAYTITGHIKRDASNNTTLMQSTVTEHYETNSNYLVQAVADDTNEALAIQCQLTTGHTAASTVRRWVARVETTEVGF